MELPQKFEINHEFHDTATSKIMSKINELIEYLESQKEVVGCGFGCRGDDVAVRCKVHNQEEPKGECICKYTSGHHTKCPAWVDEGVMKKYVPQPKQIDVQALLSEYEELGHDVENKDN